jgi:hypothetical protein
MTFDSMMRGSGLMAVNVGEAENASRRLPGVARNTVGLRLTDRAMASAELGGDVTGRISVGILELAVIILVVGYIWTHNVQGGG